MSDKQSRERLREVQEGDSRNLKVEQEGLAQRGVAAMDESDDSGASSSTAAASDAPKSALKKSKGKTKDDPDMAYVCQANDALHMKLVRTAKELQDDETTFHPTFTHQIYGMDERIIGYKNLRVDLYYNAATLYTYVGMKHEGQMTATKSPSPVDRLTKEKIEWGELSSQPIMHPYTPYLEDFVTHLDDKFVPPGQQVNGYTTSDGRSFEVYKGTLASLAIKSYHDRLQTFALLFIDASWYIDATDDKWILYILFEKYRHPKTNQLTYAVAGYSTVYPFYAYPESIRYKISQYIVLPPFQRQGHGTKLLETIYRDCPKNTLDVCVEDPSDDFQHMRDRYDLQLFRKYVEENMKNQPLLWNEKLWKDAQKALKINKNQIRRCYELLKLEQLTRKGLNQESDDFKQYRLELKQRLFKLYDLRNALPDEEDRKARLGELYEAVVEEYQETIGLATSATKHIAK